MRNTGVKGMIFKDVIFTEYIMFKFTKIDTQCDSRIDTFTEHVQPFSMIRIQKAYFIYFCFVSHNFGKKPLGTRANKKH